LSYVDFGAAGPLYWVLCLWLVSEVTVKQLTTYDIPENGHVKLKHNEKYYLLGYNAV
jgi:hypothetical protein